jgi:hypothetical protein
MKTKMVLAMPNRIISETRGLRSAEPGNTNPDCEAYAEKKADGIDKVENRSLLGVVRLEDPKVLRNDVEPGAAEYAAEQHQTKCRGVGTLRKDGADVENEVLIAVARISPQKSSKTQNGNDQ